MKLQTTRLGEIEVYPDQIITFPKGILSFEEYKQFAILPAEENEENPFFFLQSTEEESLCFFMLDTFIFFTEYNIELDEPTIKDLEITSPEEILIFTIVTAKESLKEATTNLKGPIIVNIKKKLGKQILLDKGDYLIKQPLFVHHKDVQDPEVTSKGQKG